MKKLSNFFAVLALILAVGTILLCVWGLNARPRILGTSEEADQRTEALMKAIRAGDLPEVSKTLLDQPAFADPYEFEHAYSSVLWEFYTDSLTYSFPGACYATDTGLAREVTVTALDVPRVVSDLAERVQKIQEEAGEDEALRAFVYEADGSVREDLLADLTRENLENARDEEAFFIRQTLTLRLALRDGQWWILPDPAIFKLLSGEAAA